MHTDAVTAGGYSENDSVILCSLTVTPHRNFPERVPDAKRHDKRRLPIQPEHRVPATVRLAHEHREAQDHEVPLSKGRSNTAECKSSGALYIAIPQRNRKFSQEFDKNLMSAFSIPTTEIWTDRKSQLNK